MAHSKKNQAASGQKGRWKTMMRTAARSSAAVWGRDDSAAGPSGRSRTQTSTRTQKSRVAPPMTRKELRQPHIRLSLASGPEAMSDPTPPMATSTPVITGNSR